MTCPDRRLSIESRLLVGRPRSELSQSEAESLVQALAESAALADRALPARGGSLTRRLLEHLGPVSADVSSTSMSTGRPIVSARSIPVGSGFPSMSRVPVDHTVSGSSILGSCRTVDSS